MKVLRGAGLVLVLIALCGAEGTSPPLPELISDIATPAQRFVAAHGRRGMVIGYAAQTLEGWIYPFRIFHGFSIGFRQLHASEITPGRALLRRIIVRPESVTRIYSAETFTVRETLFVPLDRAGFVVLYELESREPLDVIVNFEPDLDLMWPGGIGGQSYAWDQQRQAFLLQEASGKYGALVGSPAVVSHSDPASYVQPWRAERELSLELKLTPGAAPVILAAALSLPSHYEAPSTYQELLTSTPRLLAESRDHYRTLLADHLQIESPDDRVNRAYAWALITLDQAYVCNPYLGCGLVAGYGPSRDTRRPQYAWFFAGDALNNVWALEAAGDHALTRQAVRFIQKYQNQQSGEIWHEISQSATLIDWFKNYPFGFRHVDISPSYLLAMWNVYQSSGDQDFLRDSWNSLERAYHYCVSRIDAYDSLITTPPGEWGSDEASTAVVKDVGLEAAWVAGGEAFANIAAALGHDNEASQARAAASRARSSLGRDFWDARSRFFIEGFTGTGQRVPQQMNAANAGIWHEAFPRDQAESGLDRLAAAAFETDWGTRSIPVDDKNYEAASYGHGSVWPLGTGIQVLAFYRYHRPLSADPLLQALTQESFLDSPGHIPEVFTGDFYRQLDVSVPEQIWSSGIYVTALLRGMLGITPNAPQRALDWAPHLPANWLFLHISRLRIGSTEFGVNIQQRPGHLDFDFESNGPPLRLRLEPEIPLGSTNVRAAIGGRQFPAHVLTYGQDAHAQVEFVLDGHRRVEFNFNPGVRAITAPVELREGERSEALRIIRSGLQGKSYSAEVEARAGSCPILTLLTPWQVTRISGGEPVVHKEGEWNYRLRPDDGHCGGSGAYQRFTFTAEFAQ